MNVAYHLEYRDDRYPPSPFEYELLEIQRIIYLDEEQGWEPNEAPNKFDLRPDTITVLAVSDDDSEPGIIGSCRIQRCTEKEAPDKKEVWFTLGRMVVKSEFREHGVGTDMREGAEYKAREAGATAVVLDSVKEQQKFYSDGGYKETGKIHPYEKTDLFEMTKKL